MSGTRISWARRSVRCGPCRLRGQPLAQIGLDTCASRITARHKGLSRESLVGVDIARRGLDSQFRRQGKRIALAAVAMRGVVKADELLVKVVGF